MKDKAGQTVRTGSADKCCYPARRRLIDRMNRGKAGGEVVGDIVVEETAVHCLEQK
jgi:hypothetical protein